MADLFTPTVRTYGPRLIADTGCKPFHAAGAFGNFGVETGGFAHLQEIKPVVKGSRGGWSWAQWTGPRRRAFEEFARERGLPRAGDETAYQFLLHELAGPERAARDAWLATATLEDATRVFMERYERPGVKHLAKRIQWARKALAVLEGRSAPRATKPRPTKAAPPAATPSYLRQQSSIGLARDLIRPLQAKLKALGYERIGLVDGDWGPDTRATVLAWRADHGMDTGAPYLTQEVYDAIMADNAPRGVSKARAEADVRDIKASVPEVVDPVLKQKSAGTIGTVAAGGGLLASILPDGWLDALTRLKEVLDGIPTQVWLVIVGGTFGAWWLSNSRTIAGIRAAWRSRNLV